MKGQRARRSADFAAAASAWSPVCAGAAALRISAAATTRDAALRLDYDFKAAGGFVVARRALRRALPEFYALRFRLRAKGAVNGLELKLVDVSGRNVWRRTWPRLPAGRRWRTIEVPDRELEFAWGPAGGGTPTEIGALEFAIVAGEGGAGTVWIAGLELVERRLPAPRARASSQRRGFEARRVLERGWKPQAGDAQPWVQLDWRKARELDGLVIEWAGAAPASGFRVRVSDDGRRWKTWYAAVRAGGARSYLYLSRAAVRRLRLELGEACAGAALRLPPFEFSRSIESFWHAVAAREPRGAFPRWLLREQSLWTPVGAPDGSGRALMNEDGLVEVGAGSFSLEPMLWLDGRLHTWADVKSKQELHAGWMPVPAVIWSGRGWRLTVRAEATAGRALHVVYRFENRRAAPGAADLFVLLRPFQVTPPWQSFRGFGGVSRIHRLVWREGAVQVNDGARVLVRGAPAAFCATAFDEGPLAVRLAQGEWPQRTAVHDAFGFASGALRFTLRPGAHQAAEVVVCVPPDAEDVCAEPAADWEAALAPAPWNGPGWLEDAARAARTAAAHILALRDGAALQPGPRRYTRAWIRDGVTMGAALLRMGRAREVGDFLRWYALHQRADGFVPCIVDREGADPTVEHDSHGQFLALLADHFRFTRDAAFLEALWPHAQAAVHYIAAARERDGLMPASISHEGYAAQPVHSYWDGFWTLRGLRDAAFLAAALGRKAQARRWLALAAQFGAALYQDIEAIRKQKRLDYLPASREWADFDPAATANALALLDVPPGLDRAALEKTFDRYLADWRRRGRGETDWASYTPYEVRIVGALVRLGRRAEAVRLLRYFLAERRPRAWNQWPEIAWRDPRAPGHLGDLPHAWIGAEYLLALRSLYVYERDDALVLAAGLTPAMLDGEGVRLHAAPTAFGTLGYRLRRLDARRLRFEIAAGVFGRLILRPPLRSAIAGVTVDGAAWREHDARAVTLPGAPAEVIIHERTA